MSQGELFTGSSPEIGEVEERLRAEGIRTVIGVDEAGRGPLAGPVHAAAFWLDLASPLPAALEELNDSKKLQESTRERLFDALENEGRPMAIGVCQAEVIDEINVLQATFRAMRSAVEEVIEAVGEPPELILVDGNMIIPGVDWKQEAFIKGDARSQAIAAASILAKVSRDRVMREADKKWPQYGFLSNKGYGSAMHRKALRKFGPCELHRRSFAGVLPEGEPIGE